LQWVRDNIGGSDPARKDIPLENRNPRRRGKGE